MRAMGPETFGKRPLENTEPDRVDVGVVCEFGISVHVKLLIRFDGRPLRCS